ncbi:hypothetical protein [Sulfitobacter pacificus]|uniref:Transferrin-binding protein B C-lobe/N-lobe beta barrel domain-containing protein n=1 Tax=Sulfitobacter pacificus TaxID=1499314 RepID=A0ABQ5VJC7_9RHOB|nr:hypothetical protein [Sulfitobacter pacificus]GLQ27220.1 hypothetical protein GCM10007927_20230 [Sulfitobacter pacificus]
MKINAAGLLLCTFLVGCGGGDAPFGEDATDSGTDGGTGTGGDVGDGTGIIREGLPPGTASPAPDSRIVRSEPTEAEGGNLGDGSATGIRYDGDTDVFTVDGLAFDGGNRYARGVNVSSLNGEFAVYEAFQQFPDSSNDELINQFTHRAIYGVSRNLDSEGNPQTQFAIVRTGAYIPYGFGGFVYQREGSVELPTGGQAVFNGRSAGLRDYDGSGGLEYSTANVEIAIDFESFNASSGVRGDAVRGTFSNRRVYDVNGADITDTIVGRINAKNDASLGSIPDARFEVGPGVMDANGEIIGNVFSNFVDENGRVREYESGKYYAIVSGDDTNEIVGVLVTENTAELDNVTVRDTSGFIVYRD